MVKHEQLKNIFVNVAKTFELHYECDADGYRVTYNTVSEKALYEFPNKRQIESVVTAKQKDYFVRLGYWRVG